MALAQPVEPASDTRLILTTLGGAALVCARKGAAPAEVFGPGKPLALVTYLALSPRRTASREHLLGLLWADSEPERAHHTLRQTVWQICHAVRERLLLTQNGDIALTMPVETDCGAFLAAVEAGDLERAVTLYTGDFLPDFAVPGGAGFEQWADIERIRLRTAFLRSAESLARRHLAQGHVREAQRLARRARDADRLNEAGWRLLLETLVAGCDWTAAAMEAEAVEHLLAAEECEPEPATRAAIRRARQVPVHSSDDAWQALVAELVGREKEFAAIVGAWDAARRGGARHVHVTAPAGLGKTRLLQDTLARLRASAARAVYARANPGSRDLPYAFAAEVAAALARLPGTLGISPGSAGALVALNPALSSTFSVAEDHAVGEEAARRRTIALTELIQAVLEESPVALFLDDLHWADHASRRALDGVLAGLPDDARLLVVTTCRPAPGFDFPTRARPMVLEPLTTEQTTELMASLGALPAAPPDLPRIVREASGGSPLLILECLLDAMEEGNLHLEDGIWSVPNPGTLAARFSAGSAMRDRIARLERNEAWLLLLLATGGMPIQSELLAAAAGRDAEVVASGLAALEHRGLVRRAFDGWEPAHDEIAELAVSTASTEARTASTRSLGAALVAAASSSAQLAPRGAQLLAQAGEEEALSHFLNLWVRQRRRAGDHRGIPAMLEDLLRTTNPALLARLARRVPLRDRLGLSPSALGWATAALVVLAGAAAAGFIALTGPRPEALLVTYLFRRSGETELRATPLLPPSRPNATLDVTRGRTLPWGDYRLSSRGPDGAWLAARPMPDSGGDELFLLREGQSPRRLTYSPNDDVSGNWAPDGSAVVFATGRWDARGWYDLAVLDVVTGATRPLTRSPGAEMDPVWSPDGSRIAFSRQPPNGDPTPDLCVIAVDGTGERCLGPGDPLSWRDAGTIIAVRDVNPQILLAVDVTLGAAEELDRGDAFAQSGTWVLARTVRPGMPTVAWYAYPHGDKTSSYRLLADSDIVVTPLVVALGERGDYVDRLAITHPPGDSIPLGIAAQMIARGFDLDGKLVPAPYVSWTSSDTSVARVDATGLIRPLRPGTVIIRASVGGWRTDSIRLTVAQEAVRDLLQESWSTDWRERWVPFGSPLPDVVAGPQGADAFWNRGDGSHASGAYTRATFDGRRGIGVEFALAGAITDGHWQTLAMELADALDSGALEAWDHRTGDSPFTKRPSGCLAHLPTASGIESAATIAVTANRPTAETFMALPEPTSDSRWQTIRLQLLPDGRCGLAVNGRPMFVSTGRVDLTRRFRVVTRGNSVGTRMLVGPLRVWAGVRRDVRWDSVDGRAVGR